ncbi:MAG TPA: prepilin-type N-terminal cleavage/methylation domain-containing protein [Candidatus Paceibacterota bacterium]
MRGFTVIEIAIAVTILAIVAGTIFAGFHNLLLRQTLGQINEDVVSFLRETREKTTGREGGFSYGVHIEESELVRFRAPSYMEGAPSNEQYTISEGFHVASYALNGGGQEIIFENITGATTQFGDIVLERQNNSSVQKTIHIYETGSVETE